MEPRYWKWTNVGRESIPLPVSQTHTDSDGAFRSGTYFVAVIGLVGLDSEGEAQAEEGGGWPHPPSFSSRLRDSRPSLLPRLSGARDKGVGGGGGTQLLKQCDAKE